MSDAEDLATTYQQMPTKAIELLRARLAGGVTESALAGELGIRPAALHAYISHGVLPPTRIYEYLAWKA
jgi:hypothetical protein